MGKRFYCECGMVVPLGTPVEKQIKHLKGSYHRKRMKAIREANKKIGDKK